MRVGVDLIFKVTRAAFLFLTQKTLENGTKGELGLRSERTPIPVGLVLQQGILLTPLVLNGVLGRREIRVV